MQEDGSERQRVPRQPPQGLLWRRLRDYLVVPITEEFVFRGCMAPLLLLGVRPRARYIHAGCRSPDQGLQVTLASRSTLRTALAPHTAPCSQQCAGHRMHSDYLN